MGEEVESNESDDLSGGLLSLFSVKDVSTSHSFTQSSSGIAKEISNSGTIFGLVALFISVMIMIGCTCLYRYQRKKAQEKAAALSLKEIRGSQRSSQRRSQRSSQRSSQRGSGRDSRKGSGRGSGRGSASGFETIRLDSRIDD